MIVGMLAGEPSGDNLGAPLIRALRAASPGVKVCGVGGPAMINAGMESWFEMERLSVNGIVDPLLRLPDLLRILFSTRDQIIASGAQVFVGVDYNFFNLMLEGMLRKRGIPTVHYVSPTVWAWRSGRIKKIKRNVDLMMTLYPFETAIYRENGIDAIFVGHPKADEISPEFDVAAQVQAREQLGLIVDQPVLAVLPGSRSSEVKLSGQDFFAAAELCLKTMPELQLVIPAANPARKEQIEQLLELYPGASQAALVTLGQSQEAMRAAEAVLVNSGTATLEAMLLKRPMVMSYRLGEFTYAIVSRMMKTAYFALPNILAGRQLVPEFIQDAATPEALAEAVLQMFPAAEQAELLSSFHDIHLSLRKGAATEAAKAVLGLAESRGTDALQ